MGFGALTFIVLLIATYLLASHLYVWDAFLLLDLAAVGLLWRLARAVASEKAPLIRFAYLTPRTFAGWGRVGALLVAAAVALAARRYAVPHDFTALFLWWLLAVACFAATLLIPLLRREHGVARFGNHGYTLPLVRADWRRDDVIERYGLAALLLVAFLVRAVALGRVPANLGGDEGTQLLDGLRLVARPLGTPFATGWYSVPTMSFLAYGVAMRLFGATIAGGRMLSALVGTLTVLTTFLLARTLGGRRVGWLAALLLAFSHYHIHFSRLASNQIFDPLIGTLAIWLVWLALENGEWQMANDVCSAGVSPALQQDCTCLWGLAGFVAGVGWYGYFGARWVTALLGLIVAWRMLVEPRFMARHWRGLALFAGGWLVVVLPLLGWYTLHPSALTERYNAVSIFASGWLEQAIAITGKPASALLLEQLWKSATAFHFTFDPTFWYFPQLPLVDFITGAFMIVGMAAALARVRWPSRAVTLLWFGSTLVMAWGLTENPPSSQRGLLLIPAAVLLAAWGVEALHSSERLRRKKPDRAPAWAGGATILLGALLAATVLFNLGFYFGIYTPRRSYGNPTAEVATTFARVVLAYPHPACAAAPDACDSIEERPVIYFFGPPALYWDFGSLAFLLRDQPGVDVLPGEMPEAVSRPARFVFVAERLGDREAVQLAYPGGVFTEVTAPDGRVLAVVYDW